MAKVGIKGLVLDKGYNYESVKSYLENEGIRFRIDLKPAKTNDYFRYSSIAVEKPDKVARDFGSEKREVTAYYEITPGKFDFSHLDGKVRFKKGKLVEIVELTKL